ncbi:hypothetical protein Droror1_Dr00021929 [Drosera rotundifolia]
MHAEFYCLFTSSPFLHQPQSIQADSIMDSGAIDAFHYLPQVICFSHNPQFHVPFSWMTIRARVFLIWGLIDSLFNALIGFVESVYDEIIHSKYYWIRDCEFE